MQKKCCIHVCQNYLPEVQAVIQQEHFENVTVRSFLQVCVCPLEIRNNAKITLQDAPVGEDQILIAAGCVLQNRIDLQSPPWVQTQSLEAVYQLKYCHQMLANPELVDHFTRSGGYLVTPGCLTHWRSILKNWGFNQAGAQSFFKESASQLVLLDTHVDPQSTNHLTEFAEYVGLPFLVVPVGLDYFRLMLSKVILEWQASQDERQIPAPVIDETCQQLANYALAFDLLATLSQMMIETDAIQEISNIFTRLFAPAKSLYISIDSNKILTSYPKNEQIEDLVDWALNNQEGYRRLTDTHGFYLRISYQSTTLGAIKIDEVAFPQYLQQYLNLSLYLSPILGLTIYNARAYQKLEEKEASLHKLATTDPLTELYNRRYFSEIAENEFKRARRYNRQFSLVAIDIDHFKKVNDTCGHPAGDQVLKNLTNLLKLELRKSDICARMGGEEFIILLPETPLPNAYLLAERLRLKIAEMVIQVEGNAIHITASFGVTGYDETFSSLDEILQKSDQALYRAKINGRNQVVIG